MVDEPEIKVPWPAWVTQQLKGKVGIPLVATNRINTPEVAEQILADGMADMVSPPRAFATKGYGAAVVLYFA